MPSRIRAKSLCPKQMENTAPLPSDSPSKMEVRNVISVNAEPTAASAVRAEEAADDQRVGHVVALLQKVAQNHWHGEEEHRPHHRPAGQVPVHRPSHAF